jgi:hypothetical protein
LVEVEQVLDGLAKPEVTGVQVEVEVDMTVLKVHIRLRVERVLLDKVTMVV